MMNDKSNPDSAGMPDPARRQAARAALRRTFLLVGGMIAATGLGLAACAPPPPAPVPPAPAPAPTPTPTPTPAPVVVLPPSDWRDVAITPGDWTYRADSTATRAIFAAPDGAAQFVMACELPTRTIRLWRTGEAPDGATMTITTTSAARTLPLTAEAGPTPMLSAPLSARDPLVDAMVFSRGRFAVAVPGLALLTVPSWAEVARVTEDCR